MAAQIETQQLEYEKTLAEYIELIDESDKEHLCGNTNL